MADDGFHVEGHAAKCDSKRKIWSTRWFELHGTTFSYYSSKGQEPKGVFDLSRLAPGFLSCDVTPSDPRRPPPGNHNLVLMMPSGREFHMSFIDEGEFEKWVAVFRRMEANLDSHGEVTDSAAEPTDIDIGLPADHVSPSKAAKAMAIPLVGLKAHGMISKTSRRKNIWQQRWFQLDKFQLSIFLREGQTKPKQVIDLASLAPAFLEETYIPRAGMKPARTPYTLGLRLPTGLLGLCFSDSGDREYWLGWFRYAHALLHPPLSALAAAPVSPTAGGSGATAEDEHEDEPEDEAGVGSGSGSRSGSVAKGKGPRASAEASAADEPQDDSARSDSPGDRVVPAGGKDSTAAAVHGSGTELHRDGDGADIAAAGEDPLAAAGSPPRSNMELDAAARKIQSAVRTARENNAAVCIQAATRRYLGEKHAQESERELAPVAPDTYSMAATDRSNGPVAASRPVDDATTEASDETPSMGDGDASVESLSQTEASSAPNPRDPPKDQDPPAHPAPKGGCCVVM